MQDTEDGTPLTVDGLLSSGYRLRFALHRLGLVVPRRDRVEDGLDELGVEPVALRHRPVAQDGLVRMAGTGFLSR